MTEQPTVPAYLEARKYMSSFAENGNSDMETDYKPAGLADASVAGLELKYRKKKDYEIQCEVEVEYAETKHEDSTLELPSFPPRCWSCKSHEHARFATLIPIKIRLVVLPSAVLPDVKAVIDRMFEESVEKLNAWWNQKETEHLRGRYVGSLFIYNPNKFKISSGTTHRAWTDASQPLGTFLHENSQSKQLAVKTTVRILRPVSDKRCSIQ